MSHLPPMIATGARMGRSIIERNSATYSVGDSVMAAHLRSIIRRCDGLAVLRNQANVPRASRKPTIPEILTAKKGPVCSARSRSLVTQQLCTAISLPLPFRRYERMVAARWLIL